MYIVKPAAFFDGDPAGHRTLPDVPEGWSLQHPVYWRRSVHPPLAVRWGRNTSRAWTAQSATGIQGCSLSGFAEEGAQGSLVNTMISGAFSLGFNPGNTPYLVAL